MTQIIAFISQAGDAGKTTLATAMAVELVKQERPCLLIDLDLEHRDAGYSAFNIHKTRSRRQKHLEQFDIELATDVKNAKAIAREAVLSQDYDCVIIDCPSRATAAIVDVLETTDLIVYPMRPTQKDFKLTRSTLLALMGSQIPLKRIAITLSRCRTQTEAEAYKTLLRKHSAGSFQVIDPVTFEKAAYNQSATDKGLTICEGSPLSLRMAAKAQVMAIIDRVAFAADPATQTFEAA